MFVNGAGISVAAGLPTYRGSDTTISPDTFSSKAKAMLKRKAGAEEEQRQWYERVQKVYEDNTPTKMHELQARLVHKGGASVVTQNIDGLERKALASVISQEASSTNTGLTPREP